MQVGLIRSYARELPSRSRKRRSVALRFEWSPGKASSNLAKHGVSFDGVLPVTEDVVGLVAAYAARGILPSKLQADMTHIALATLAEVDALVSWNFKHIVRLEKIRLFNAVNAEWGHKP